VHRLLNGCEFGEADLIEDEFVKFLCSKDPYQWYSKHKYDISYRIIGDFEDALGAREQLRRCGVTPKDLTMQQLYKFEKADSEERSALIFELKKTKKQLLPNQIGMKEPSISFQSSEGSSFSSPPVKSIKHDGSNLEHKAPTSNELMYYLHSFVEEFAKVGNSKLGSYTSTNRSISNSFHSESTGKSSIVPGIIVDERSFLNAAVGLSLTLGR
jgi:hypothetical protein